MPAPGEKTMRKKSNQRRQKVIIVASLSVALAGSLYFLLIKAQQRHLVKLGSQKNEVQQKYSLMKTAIASTERLVEKLDEATNHLAQLELGMASGDLYSWTIGTIRQFKLPYKVDVPQFGQIEGPKEVNLLPKFPYKQATLTIAGTGRFNDLGRFIAEFENQFPYIRLLN